MIFKQFKIPVLILLFTSTVFAQKYDKKFSENFTTNKDVAVTINASNAEIDVATWNKNEVSVEAVIEVEGLDKKAAEKFLKNWKFEALGNKSKVQIKTGGNSFHSFGKDNFVYFNSNESNLPRILEFHGNEDVIVLPEVPEMPMIEIPEIEIPEINFDEIVYGLEDIEFDFDKYAKDGGNYFFQWKDGVNDITIKSKKEWEKFKKTKEYKKFKKEQERRKKAFKKRIKAAKARKIDKKELRETLAKAREEIKKIDRVELRKELAKVRKEMHKVNKELKKNKFSYAFSSNKNDFTIDGKKVKVTKKIVIKVPASATFDLNTRHCKVKLPKTKASGKVSYGTFKADVLNGGELNVSFSPVNINSLNACTLFLNNVTDAHVASVANTTLNSNSSALIVDNIYKDVALFNRFGELIIHKIHPNYNTFNLLLNYANAKINFPDTKADKFTWDVSDKKKSLIDKPSLKLTENGIYIQGNFTGTTKSGKAKVTGKFSEITLK